MFYVRVRLSDMKRSALLTPNGGLTKRRVHAARITDREMADRIAAEIEQQNDGAKCSVVPISIR